jgi:hypothetical protein
MIDIEKIQEMWKEDSNIDIDNLHNESLRVPSLHAKYYEIYNNISLLRKRSEFQYKQKKLERYNYYNGKAEPETYKEEPFPYKVRDKEGMNRYLEADKQLSDIFMKIEYYDTILKYLEEIIKMISNRTYQIKNSIDFLKFQSGI